MAQDLVSRQQQYLRQLYESTYMAICVPGDGHSNLAAEAARWFGRHNVYGLDEMDMGFGSAV